MAANSWKDYEDAIARQRQVELAEMQLEIDRIRIALGTFKPETLLTDYDHKLLRAYGVRWE